MAEVVRPGDIILTDISMELVSVIFRAFGPPMLSVRRAHCQNNSRASRKTVAELGVPRYFRCHDGPLSIARVIALAWSLLASSTLVAAASEDSVRAFVERVNEASVSFFSSGSEADARERCRALLAWAFDVPAMGREAMGRTWDKIPEQERGEFLQAFEEDVISGYLRRMRAPGTTMTFVGNRPAQEGFQRAASRRSVPGKNDQIWIWWMRPDGQTWRIVDLVLNGHSAVATEAHEYATVLENNDNDMDALIAFMRKRAAQ